jgi:hypothetical protein
MENSAEFDAHVQRLLAPLKPGLEYVQTAAFVEDEFEPDEEDLVGSLTAEMLPRARAAAIECVGIVEGVLMDQIRNDATRFLEGNGDSPGWNAPDADAMQVNLEAFCGYNIHAWDTIHFPQYKEDAEEKSPGFLDASSFEYVKSFVGSALAALPYHITEGDEEIYYDSDETAKAEEE